MLKKSTTPIDVSIDAKDSMSEVLSILLLIIVV